MTTTEIVIKIHNVFNAHRDELTNPESELLQIGAQEVEFEGETFAFIGKFININSKSFCYVECDDVFITMIQI